MRSKRFQRLVAWTAWSAVLGYVVLAGLSGTLFQPGTVVDLEVPATLAGRGAALLGLMMVVTFPGLLLALVHPSSSAKPVTDLLLEALALSTAAHIINLSLVKLAGLVVSPASLIGAGLLEVVPVWAWAWRRRRWAPLRPPNLREGLGLGGAALLTIYLTVSHTDVLLRSLGDYFHEEGWPEDAGQAREEVAGVTIERSPRWVPVQAFEYTFQKLSPMTSPETLVLHADGYRRVTLRFLWQGPVGSRLRIDCEDRQAEARIERAPVEREDEGPTLRYLDTGIDSVVLRLPVRSSRRCVLTPDLPPGRHGTLLDLSGCPAEVLWDTEALGGWRPVHYYQILNIAENVAWSRALFADLWTTKNQPPLWSYVYSSTNLYVGDGLWAINLLFFLIVGLSVHLAWAVVLLERPHAHPALLLLIGLIGVSHARIMLEPGSTNFPDNLYALAMIASLYLLLRGRHLAFAAAGVATTLLRYSGSGAIVLMGLLAARFRRTQRRHMLQALGTWALAMTAVSAAFFLAALWTGTLREWLDVLYFETFPEHFHGNYALGELIRRPPAFYASLLKVTGLMPLCWVFIRGTLPRLTAALTVGYTALLCMVDHFPSHYFVPPMYLVAITTAATLDPLRGWKRPLLTALCLVGLIWGLHQPL